MPGTTRHHQDGNGSAGRRPPSYCDAGPVRVAVRRRRPAAGPPRRHRDRPPDLRGRSGTWTGTRCPARSATWRSPTTAAKFRDPLHPPAPVGRPGLPVAGRDRRRGGRHHPVPDARRGAGRFPVRQDRHLRASPDRRLRGPAVPRHRPGGPVAGPLPDAIGPQIHLDDGTDLPLFEPVSDLDDHARVRRRGRLRVQRRPVGDGGPAQLDRRLVQVGLDAGQPRLPPRGRRRRRSSTSRWSSGPPASRARRRRPARTTGRLTISIGAADGPEFPPVGLRCADPAADWSDRARAVLRAIGPAHLRADVLPGGRAGPRLGLRRGRDRAGGSRLRPRARRVPARRRR